MHRILMWAVLASGLALAGCNANRVQVVNGGSEAIVTKNISVVRGQVAKVNFFAQVNPDCSEVVGASVRITQPAAHGVADVIRTTDFPTFHQGNPRAACNSHRVAGWRVTYRAPAEFVGDDAFSFDEYYVQGIALHVNVIVHIE